MSNIFEIPSQGCGGALVTYISDEDRGAHFSIKYGSNAKL
jgi:hypothetical protein